ncbi:MAG: hypothetical protein H7A21_09510 [Spirochaetales bacterium]|nr:hypothetical protein [Spirochaetales bacterium]
MRSLLSRHRGCHGRRHGYEHHHEESFMGGHFGVRRPVRFLSYKLDLDEGQTKELARILDRLKTDRAQAAVDERRTLSAFAEAVQGATFAEEVAGSGASTRKKTADLLADAVVTALREIHGLLNEDQRERLAYLIRTGALSL